MVIIPKSIQDSMLADAVKYNIRLHFPNAERTDICNNQIVEGSAKFTESLCSQDSLKFGLCESPTFECETVGVGNIANREIDIIYEILCDANITGAEFKTDIQKFVFPILMGRFFVTSCERQADMQHRKIMAYGGLGAMGVKMPDFEIFKQSLTIDSNAPYIVDLVKMALSLVDDVPTGEPLTLSTSYSTFYISQSKNIEFRVDSYEISNANQIDNVLKIKHNMLISYDDVINQSKDLVLKFCEEKGIQLTEIERKTVDNMFAVDVATTGPRSNDRYAILKPTGRYMGINTLGQSVIYGCVINSNLIYPVLQYGTSSGSGSIQIPYRVRLFYNATPQGQSIVFRDNVSISEMSLNLPRYEARADRVRIGASSFFRIDDASAITKVDYQKVLEDNLEIIGKIGRINRNNGFDMVDVNKYFYLLPNDDLMPSEQLKPLGVNGTSIAKEQYSSLWYEESYIKPVGVVYCNYSNMNGDKLDKYLFLNGFSENSDSDDYQIYDLSSNDVISNSQYTEAQITEILQNVANALKDVSYVPVKLQCVSIPFVESGDTLEILTQNNDSITTIVLKRTLSGESYITDEFTSV